MITVMLAEDHHIVRQALTALVQGAGDMQLVGEASDGLATVRVVKQCKPNVLVLDLMIPLLHGLEVIRRLRDENSLTCIIVLSAHSEEHYVAEAICSGAMGYVLKDCATSNLIEAIRAVAAGKNYFSPLLAERVIEMLIHTPNHVGLDPHETLTGRERLILQLAAEGLSTPDIARRLCIKPRTAESHRANLMRKLMLHSQTDLVRYAIRREIITA